VEFFLELSVLALWPRRGPSAPVVLSHCSDNDLLDTTWVQRGLVDVLARHDDRSLGQCSRMEVVLLLLIDLLTNKVLFEGSR